MSAGAGAWSAPPLWSVPPAWAGERCFILCGGASLRAQRAVLDRLRGRIIAVKHAIVLRPTADILFLAGERLRDVLPLLLARFRGGEIVVRGRGLPELPASARRVGRSDSRAGLTHDRQRVSGRDAGTSAINLAYHLGATEIVLLGYDMHGGHWCTGELPHPLPSPPAAHFRRHLEVLPRLAADLCRAGVRVVNCSPESRVTVFDQQPLEAFL